MRVDREKLIFHALCVLEQLADRCGEGRVEGDCDARLALAVLFAFSRSGDRSSYDGFWRNLTCPHHQSTETQENYCREAHAHTNIRGIIRDVGAPETPDFSGAISKAADRLKRRNQGPPAISAG